MRDQVNEYIHLVKDDLKEFFRDLVSIKSLTGKEGEIAQCVHDRMIQLGYDKAFIDPIGNVIGIVGNGPVKVLFDAHMDTVDVCDPEDWTMNPYGAEVKDDCVYGRGTVDTKSSVASMVYAGHAIKKLGLDQGKTVYISASIMEEDFDVEPLTRVMEDNQIKPDYVVIGEPSQLKVAIGHKGRAAIKISLKGVSAHGSAPENGVNPIYGMNTIIGRVEALGNELIELSGKKGSLALTKIDCTTASINAIPSECVIYLDRRLAMNFSNADLTEEMNNLVSGTKASWEILNIVGNTWKNEEIKLHSFLPAWEIDEGEELVLAARETFKNLQGKELVIFKWNFCTNGIATAGKLGIPTIGFGPGNEKLAHMKDEHCSIVELIDACKFYTLLLESL